MKIVIPSLCLLLFASLTCAAPPIDQPVRLPNVSLQDYRGKVWTTADFQDHKYLVVAFLGTECPLVKLYGPRLEALKQQYETKGVGFVGVNPNSHDSVTEIAAFARRHGLTFPILKDVGNKLADQLGATRTPEVFVFDQERLVRYQGRIDDQYGVSYIRDEAKVKNLKQALDELLAGKQVSVAKTKAYGCLIGRVREVKDAKVTYAKHIAPILQNRCVECHRKGEIAPFALTDPSEVIGWADMIAEVVNDGRMPPWHANPKYGHFANDRHLTAEEKALIKQWVDNGAPVGDLKDVPKAKTYVSGWQLSREPDAVVKINAKPFRVPAQGTVRYQHFRVDPGFKEEKWVTAAQIVPGNRAVVHHILAFAVPKSLAGLAAVAGEGRGFLAGYVPGQRAHAFPKGMAKRIPANSILVFQVHYTPIGTEQFDVSKIGFLFADPKTVTHEVKTTSVKVSRFGLRIPPKADNHKVVARNLFGLPECQVLGFMPHMHLRGKSFRYEATYPDGKKEILLDVPNYDFNWQTSYRLAQPKSLPSGTRVQCVAHFDNSENNLNNPDPSKEVRWGPQTWDEMMIGYFDIARPVKHTDDNQPKKPKSKPQLDKAALLFQTLDKNRDGKIVRSEVPKRLMNQFGVVDRNNDDEVTLEELRAALSKKR